MNTTKADQRFTVLASLRERIAEQELNVGKILFKNQGSYDSFRELVWFLIPNKNDLKEFISLGGDINIYDCFLMETYCQINKQEEFLFLLKNGGKFKDINQTIDSIRMAVDHNESEIAESIILNILPTIKDEALFSLACLRGNKFVFDTILNNGIRVKDSFIKTALLGNNKEMATKLINYKDKK